MGWSAASPLHINNILKTRDSDYRIWVLETYKLTVGIDRLINYS